MEVEEPQVAKKIENSSRKRRGKSKGKKTARNNESIENILDNDEDEEEMMVDDNVEMATILPDQVEPVAIPEVKPGFFPFT